MSGFFFPNVMIIDLMKTPYLCVAAITLPGQVFRRQTDRSFFLYIIVIFYAIVVFNT